MACLALGVASVTVSLTTTVAADTTDRPWLEARRSPDERATLAVRAMTLDEKIGLLHGPMALPGRGVSLPPEAILAAGYVPGVPRLGIPALYETDASLGIANPNNVRPGDVATALPSSLALAATFDPSLAYRAGAMLGSEAHAKGFNVLLGGGMNLARDPRNGRNFEYLGEDPLLAGVMAGEEVRGTQDQHVISTVKHFALNANELNRQQLDARIDKTALRESDLLAFEIAIERGHPGSIMCAYNEVNGAYACGNHWLLSDVLKRDWHYPGWVMSDWGAVHSVDYAAAGLDQESGEQLDKAVFFAAPLRAAVNSGALPMTRIDDMVHRILRSMFDVGVAENPPVKTDIDFQAHAALPLEIARAGLVLLKNEHDILPLADSVASIAVIGGHANLGVLSGGGSAQVVPANGPAARVPIGGGGVMANFGGELFDPSAPYDAIHALAPKSTLRFDAGDYPARAAAAAAKSDVAIVFVTRHELEGSDVPNLDLPDGQDAVIEAVAKANPRTIVVLETGNPVAMPWLSQVAAVLASWYPGQEGGQAIADLLFGVVNPSGRLPLTFPRSESDLVRPRLPNFGTDAGVQVHVDYTEGAQVGYRGYDQHTPLRTPLRTPLFPFGFGLSYTRFDYTDVHVSGGKTLTISVTVTNTGTIAGADVPQAYLTSAAGSPVLRLVGFQRVLLQPRERRTLSISADPRLLGSFDELHHRWTIKRGVYHVRVAHSANDLGAGGDAMIAGGEGRLRP